MISIIIVSWNVKDLLKKCIESISKYSSGEYEIIVVDNASGDGTVEMLENKRHSEFISESKHSRNKILKQSFGNTQDMANDDVKITIIKNKENFGFAKACNQGIGIAKGDYILLLNPDTEFIEDSLGKLQISNFEFRDAILGCRLLNSNRTLQPSVRRFPRVWDILVILLKLHKLFPSLLDSYLAKDFNCSRSTEVDQVMGAFFLVPKEVFQKIGLLDEKYFIWFEEVDFCRRAKAAGYKIIYYPAIKIIHHGSQSFNQAMTLKKQLWFFRSAIRYFLG